VVNVHGRHQPGVMDLLAGHAALTTSLSHSGCTSAFSARITKKRFIRAIWAAAHAQLMPSPFASTGRVATAQNSTRFCAARQGCTACRRSMIRVRRTVWQFG
jgi:hypothetical protein